MAVCSRSQYIAAGVPSEWLSATACYLGLALAVQAVLTAVPIARESRLGDSLGLAWAA